MSSVKKRHLVLQIVATDNTFRPVEGGWVGRCIHCNTRLEVSDQGDMLGRTSLEHIIPQGHGGTDALENVALACRGCNNQKGYRQDNKGPGHAGYDKVVQLLQERRQQRWRDLPTPDDPAG
jgi:5-methylcytosine-specific restriction endonuclease McrA